MTQIDENITRMESSENPLSADVYFIEGNDYTYIIDVGSNDSAYEKISGIINKRIIITHFHQDHCENMKRIDIEDENLFVGNYTYKTIGNYLQKSHGKGTVVDSEIVIDDGVKIRILPIKNSHAKDSLCVIVNDEYLFMGDSFYSSVKGYNVSLLHDEIKLLEGVPFTKTIFSHDNTIYDREFLLGNLREIFSRRQKDNPYISNDLL